jgi:hypothetical protein
MFAGKWHTISVIAFTALAAGATAAATAYPEYAGLLLSAAAALTVAAGGTTQAARNKMPPEKS